MTLKLILLMCQIHQWEIAVSDIASAFLNTPADPSKSPSIVQAHRELPYSELMVWRYMVSEMLHNHGKPHFSQIMINKGMVQMKSDSRTFLKKIN